MSQPCQRIKPANGAYTPIDLTAATKSTSPTTLLGICLVFAAQNGTCPR